MCLTLQCFGFIQQWTIETQHLLTYKSTKQRILLCILLKSDNQTGLTVGKFRLWRHFSCCCCGFMYLCCVYAHLTNNNSLLGTPIYTHFIEIEQRLYGRMYGWLKWFLVMIAKKNQMKDIKMSSISKMQHSNRSGLSKCYR